MSRYNGRMEECSGTNEVEVVDLVGFCTDVMRGGGVAE